MNHFEAVDKLTHYVSVYVPSTMGVDTPVDNAAQVRDTKAQLSTLFGGCTATLAEGSWVSNAHELITESVTVCKSFAQALTDESLDKVYTIAHELKVAMGQAAISVEIDNELYFV